MSQFFKPTTLSAAVIAAALGLTACGGGSEDGDFSASASGTTAKGIIKGGIVTAYELDPKNSDDKFVLTSTRTLSDAVGNNPIGSYQLNLPSNYSGGPLLLTLSTDANSQMRCDAVSGCGDRTDGLNDPSNPDTVDYGEWFKPGKDAIKMKALRGPVVNGSTLDLSITPFTTMAAERGMQYGTEPFSSANIAKANSEIQQLLQGLDTQAIQPFDITDANLAANGDRDQQGYAVLTSAIANFANNKGLSYQEAIDMLVSSFANGSLIGTESPPDDTKVSLQEIVESAQQTLSKMQVADRSGYISDMEDAAMLAGNNPVENTPDEDADQTAVTKAQTLVRDLMTLANLTQQTINDPNFASAFTADFNQAQIVLDNMSSADNPLVSLTQALQMYEDREAVFEYDEYSSRASSRNINFMPGDGYIFTGGSATLESTGVDSDTNEYTTTITFNDAIVGTQTANFTITLNGLHTEGRSSSLLTGDSTSTVSDDEITTASGSITSSAGSSLIFYSQSELTFNEFEREEGGVDTLEQYHTFEINLSNMTMEITTGENTSLTVTGPFTSYGSSQIINGEEKAFLESVEFDGQLYNTGLEGMDFKLQAAMPNAALIAESDEPESANSYLQMNAKTEFSIDLDDLADTMDVDFSVLRSAYDEVSSSLRLAYDNNSIKINSVTPATFINSASPERMIELALEQTDVGTVTIISDQGVLLKITGNSSDTGVVGTLELDGVEVGVLEKMEEGYYQVTYSDGQFDIL